MNINHTYIQYRNQNEDGEICYFSVAEIIEIGNPIDEDGIDMELYSENLYERKNGQYSKL